MIGLLTESGSCDLQREDGGLMLGETSGQVIEHVLLANRGEYREFPLLGGEIVKRQRGIDSRLWCSRARSMIQAAGVAVNSVRIDGLTIKVE